MTIWTIYKITCLVNNKIYIGQHKVDDGSEDRYMGSGKLITRAIAKHGEPNFKKEILEVCDSFSAAREREEFYIRKYNATNPAIGYNITEYAWGGQPTTEETRKKISVALLGRKLSDETKQKMRKPKSPRSEEHAKNIANANRGLRWYHNPTTLESKKYRVETLVPVGWILGRGNTQKTGAERKRPKYSPEGLKKLKTVNLDTKKRLRISLTLKGHSVSIESRNKISESLKKYHGTKAGVSSTNNINRPNPGGR